MRVLALEAIFDPRQRSLPRGNLLVFGSLAAALRISDFPHNHASLWLVLPVIGVVLGTVDTARCMKKRWSFYHGGVLLCIYMDLMAAVIVLFALLYPYFFRVVSMR
jgi:hypothetical protein